MYFLRGTSYSKSIFDCWIELRKVSSAYQLQIMHITISSFEIGIEMHKLQGVKVKILFLFP